MTPLAVPEERLSGLASRLGALLQEIDEVTGGEVDALVDPGGNLSYLLRGAQQALLRQEQEFRALVENTPDLILRVDPALGVAYGNPALLGVVGQPLFAVRGRPVRELMPSPGAAEWEAALSGVVSTARPAEGEFWFGEGPEARVYHSRFEPEFGADGALASVLAVSRDTTAAHASARELAAAHARISGILESVTDAFFAVDAAWCFTYLNPQAEALLRRGRSELLGRVLWDAFPAAVDTVFESEYRRVAAERVPAVFEAFYEPLDVWVDVHAYPADDGGVAVYFRDVSARKAGEREAAALMQRLADERALLQAVVRHLPVGVVIAEAPSGQLIMGNEEVGRIFGHGYQASASIREYGEWVGFHSDGRRVQAEEWPLARALRTGAPVGPEEYGVVRSDGSRGTTRLSAAPVLDERGHPIAAVVVMVDVTAPRAVIDALRASEERYQLVNLATSDIIWDWDVQRGRLAWNEAVATLGYARASVPETLAWWSDRIHPGDRDRVMASLDEVLDDGDLYWAQEYRFRRADGSYARVFDRAHLVRGPEGQAERMIGAMLDLSQREAAEAALRHQALLLDSVEQAVIATDMQGRITYWNRSAEQLYGWTRDEAAGRLATEVTPSPEMAEEAAAILERLARGESWSGQFRVRRKDGSTFLAQVTDTPIQGPEGELVGIVGVSSDITERRELEEQLRQSQKMEAVGQLAGGVAHDFNNLLTVIQGTVGLLMADLPPGDPARDDVDQIGQAAERAAGLTRQLLAFSRRQILNPRRLHLGALIGGMLPMLQRLIGEDVDLRFQAGAGSGQVEADPGQLEQVLMNLVVNARDAISTTGGRIQVRADEVQVRLAQEGSGGQVMPAGPYAVLVVSDTGTGMPEEVRRRAFDPFFTTKEPGKGTGLGLSTVYGIVRQSEGYIFAESQPGAGTTIRVYLPLHAGPAPAPEEPPPIVPGTETVLLVEDEEAVRALTRRVLTRHGYTVLDARDGDEALEIARVQTDRIQLVISDVVMPRTSGPALARQLTGIIGDVPVLYMSGYTDDDILRRGIRTADAQFLQKPFSPHAVLARVRAVLDAHPGRTP